MIRYEVTEKELLTDIEKFKPGWLARAKTRTKKFGELKTYREASSIWSEIKPVYMNLQNNKCGYCERLLEDPEYGKIEHDLEHYRPKGEVAAWPPKTLREKRNLVFDFPLGRAWSSGYYLLAYAPFNYLTACKPCNSALKSSYFPIAGRRGPQANDPKRLKPEKPYLIYPLGSLDTDPESLIGYYGYRAVPLEPDDRDSFRRARITIDFFDLNRGSLVWARALKLRDLYVAFRLREMGNADDVVVADETISYLLSPQASHTGCLRAFSKVFQKERGEADRIFGDVSAFLRSK